MITLHPFSTARESILGLWSAQAQARRQAADARISELFVLLHGMLFTNIQRDDFEGVLARFQEKLVIEGEILFFGFQSGGVGLVAGVRSDRCSRP